MRVQPRSDAQTVPTVAQTADATVQEATTDNATAAQPRADCGRSQPRDCLRLDNMPLRQHSDNPQLSLTTCHSAHGEETTVGSVCNRELAQPGDGHMKKIALALPCPEAERPPGHMSDGEHNY